ncbi:hypothetical protein Pla52o_20740 [Novipirellula galeiformis]|uniref:BioF2-like acetyltransferase domain-containing protein n=1 Tax=Novipirellula galeiformis TaxID=2528004 RepID=A0A5C6CHL6_9BACT|nr:GNAT family N-acetyltransferase [Novipirellula galeiformis]TWU24150.1 hypothetical protein Pla52o_20740 [Novipirellula galeiformis]
MHRVESSNNVNLLFAQADTWNRLASGVPFRETFWLKPWWDRFGDSSDAYVLVARNAAGEIQGLLPLYRKAGSPRTLCNMGDNNACTDFVSILTDPIRDPAESIAIGNAMARFLCKHANSEAEGWDLIEIDGVSADDTVMHHFSNALGNAGSIVHAQSRMHTWFLKTEATWDEMLKSYSGRTRKKVNGYLARLANTPGLRKEVAETQEQLDEFLNAMIELHQRRWNAVGEPGTYGDAKLRDFVIRVANEMFQAKRLYLPVLRMDGRIIGGELCFLNEDRLYVYSNGYDLDAAELEPGRILSTVTIKHAHDQRLRGIEFMRGDEPYKQRNGAEPTQLLQLRVVAPRWWAKACHSAWSAQFEFKQWVRRHTGRDPAKVIDMTLTS